MKVGESTRRRLNQIVENEDRTVGYVARELMLRGLELYEVDGLLKSSGKLGVTSGGEVTLAPVVARIEGVGQSKSDVRRMVNSDEIKEMEQRLKPKRKTG